MMPSYGVKMAYDGLIESASFSGHESFPLRFAWLKKGYDHLRADPQFFSDPDAMVELGVGKNMVRSIRHWGLACRMWQEVPATRGRSLEPTDIGDALLADGGWDPYLEDPGTLWWLHWSLARNPERATTWTWTFAVRGGISRLTRDALVAELDTLQRELPGRTSPRSSLKRDVDVLARSYIRDGGHRRSYEDALDAPLAELGLIRAGHERGSLELLAGDWPSLPLGVFEATLAEDCAARGLRAIPLNTLLYGPGAPGRVLRLTETALVQRLVELRARGWLFDDTAGLHQLMVPTTAPTPFEALAAHYRPTPQQQAA